MASPSPSTSSAPPQTTKPFRLMDLAAELRNNIYEKAAEDGRIHLIRYGGQTRLVTNSALVQTNRQIRSEALALTLAGASGIKINVKQSLNLDYVISYVNDLSDQDFATLSANHININLALDNFDDEEENSFDTEVRALQPWLTDRDTPGTRVSKLNVTYSITDGDEHNSFMLYATLIKQQLLHLQVRGGPERA